MTPTGIEPATFRLVVQCLGKVYPVIQQENPKLAEYEHKIGT